MTFPLVIRLAMPLALLTALSLHAAAPDSPRQGFLHPPEEAKPRGYWVWPHGNFDYSAIRQELAEFKAKGLGGVDIFDLGIRDPAQVIPPGPGFLSVEQVDGIAFALAWWELSGQLHAYLARCSALLMQGEFVADAAYYYGHEIPVNSKL